MLLIAQQFLGVRPVAPTLLIGDSTCVKLFKLNQTTPPLPNVDLNCGSFRRLAHCWSSKCGVSRKAGSHCWGRGESFEDESRKQESE